MLSGRRARYRLLRDLVSLLPARKQCCRYQRLYLLLCVLAFIPRIAVPYLSFGARIYRAPRTHYKARRLSTLHNAPRHLSEAARAGLDQELGSIAENFRLHFRLIGPSRVVFHSFIPVNSPVVSFYRSFSLSFLSTHNFSIH